MGFLNYFRWGAQVETPVLDSFRIEETYIGLGVLHYTHLLGRVSKVDLHDAVGSVTVVSPLILCIFNFNKALRRSEHVC